MGWTQRDFAAMFQRIVRERYEQIGELVHDLRENLGLSQEALAHESGLSAKTISRIETPPKTGPHEIRGSTFRKLAAALGVTVADLRAPLNQATTVRVGGALDREGLDADLGEGQALQDEARPDEDQDQPGEQHG